MQCCIAVIETAGRWSLEAVLVQLDGAVVQLDGVVVQLDGVVYHPHYRSQIQYKIIFIFSLLYKLS